MNARKQPDFTMGIEEEYLLVDIESRDLVRECPDALMRDCSEVLGQAVGAEFLQCQIEIGTKVCSTSGEAHAQLSQARRCIADAAAQYGMAPMAASTHPFAHWRDQARTRKDRYAALERDHQAIAKRLMVSGMHVHIGVDDADERVDIMGQLAYFQPHILALSASSPFWEGLDTGLRSHRLTIFDGLPRTGVPPFFSSHAQYRRAVDVLIHAGIIEDATKIWWDMRPSDRYPTIESRICDMCTRVEDAVAIASLTRCLARFLHRLRSVNQRWREYDPFLIAENRWRAQRYGVRDGLIDFGAGEVVPFGDLLEELIALTQEDAAFFGCEREIAHLRTILRDGTSAERQLDVRAQAVADGADEREALVAVVDHLMGETLEGLAV